MTTKEQLQEIEQLLEANGTPAMCLILGKLIAVCQEQEYKIEQLRDKTNRIKPDALYDHYY